ncbi:DNA repair protein RecN (Recombination protein N) [Rubrobacter radiotolerans DSM 5868]|nr:DNA repair protein RecN (Recombination protein N) [Rubrobacter radiotolerans DSM 5868]
MEGREKDVPLEGREPRPALVPRLERVESFSVITEISVKNIALIESATLRFAPGLNAITGETGAGKTLLATGLQLLLGGRARAESVRKGSGRATVEGAFSLPQESRQMILADALGELAEDLSEELEDAEEIVLRRTVSEEGRSRCYVNGVTVPVRALASLGERLVSYHGQRDQARLTDPNEQLAILDGFLTEEEREAREDLRETFREVRRLRAELESILTGAEAREREVDFLRFQVSELEAAAFSAEELEELTRERDRLRNVTALMDAVSGATSALSSEALSDFSGGALEAVGGATRDLQSASAHDAALAPLAERLAAASAELEDVVYELRAYAASLEADPTRLDEVEDRLAGFRALQRKYGEDPAAYLEEARTRLARTENVEGETADLERRIREGEERLEELTRRLTAARERAARILSERVQQNLAGLNLGSTVFRARLEKSSEGPGPLGAERVEFVIRPNPGEPELPVRRFASGGELSRVMLAVRLAQEALEPGATYIFDEVDAGIGGETATAVGAKLKELGKRNQVLTITHLPQIASEADAHVVVEKGESEGRTTTRIRAVSGEERRRELARMLSGRIDDASLAHASELLVGGG